jgi:glycosyltransferase involved in cell wall biosynthesis
VKHVLCVSKPVVSPWNDSSKNLVRDLSLGVDRFHLHVMGTRSQPAALRRDNVTWEPIYADSGRFAPGLAQNARALTRVTRPDRRAAIYHFFFAPNPITSGVLRSIMRFKSQRTVQTVCSVPRDLGAARSLFFTDRVIAVSDDTRRALEAAGVENVRRIYPAVDPDRLAFSGPNPMAEELGLVGHPVVLFAGDIEVAGTPDTLIALVAHVTAAMPEARVIVAARDKNPDSAPARERLRRGLDEAGALGRVRLLAEVDRMDQLLALADVVTLPVATLYRKMDIPLVLLEALANRTPIVVSALPPLVELVSGGGGVSVPGEDGIAAAQTIVSLLADGSKRDRLGHEGRRMVVEKFSLQAMARAYEDVYTELLE